MSHDYDPNWDYELDKSPVQAVVESVARARQGLDDLAIRLGLHAPTVYFVKGLERGHLARFISGTGEEPVFVLDAKKLAKGALKVKVHLDEVVVMTLHHELAHAYLETSGIEEAGKVVEERVERFAEICYMQGEEIGVDWLKEQTDREVTRLGIN